MVRFFDSLGNFCFYRYPEAEICYTSYARFTDGGRQLMPSTVNVLICILALLTGVLIGEKYRKWKHRDDDK